MLLALVRFVLVIIFMGCVQGQKERDLSTKVATDILEFVLKRGELKNDNSIASDILGFVVGGSEDKVMSYVFERDDLPGEMEPTEEISETTTEETQEQVEDETTETVTEEKENLTEISETTDKVTESIMETAETVTEIAEEVTEEVEAVTETSYPVTQISDEVTGPDEVTDLADTATEIEEVTDIDEEVTEIVDVSGESCDSETKRNYTVTNSAPYTMSSVDGSSSATIILQQVSGQSGDQVNLVCNFSSTNQDLFLDKSCLPEIYLVSGSSTCVGLPDSVGAKQLAKVHQEGFAEVIVDIGWGELPGKCLVIVKKDECESGVEDVRRRITLIEKQDGKHEVSKARNCERLRSSGFGRNFRSLSFYGFSVILRGSTNLFQISSLPSSAVVSAPLFGGIVYTNYNRWGSWPLLHLPGWSDGTAVSIAVAMFLAYYLYAFMTASPISLLPIKRKWENLNRKSVDQISDRVDAIEGGIGSIEDGMTNTIDKAIQEEKNKWKKIIRTLDRNLLRKRNHPYFSIDKLLNKYGYVKKSTVNKQRRYEIYDYYELEDFGKKI